MSEIRRHKPLHVWRLSRRATAEVSRGPLAQILGEPRLVLDLLVQDGQRQIVSAMVLAESHIAYLGIGTDGAALRLYQNIQHLIHVTRIIRQVGVRTPGDVGEPADVP